MHPKHTKKNQNTITCGLLILFKACQNASLCPFSEVLYEVVSESFRTGCIERFIVIIHLFRLSALRSSPCGTEFFGPSAFASLEHFFEVIFRKAVEDLLRLLNYVHGVKATSFELELNFQRQGKVAGGQVG